MIGDGILMGGDGPRRGAADLNLRLETVCTMNTGQRFDSQHQNRHAYVNNRAVELAAL